MKQVLKKTLALIAVMAMTLTLFGCADLFKPSEKEAETVKFKVLVTDADGNQSEFEVTTNASNVGDALLKANLIAGEDSQYGLYVKTVNGITVDYEKDGKYWAFYIDGEMAPNGVSLTPCEAGKTYEFRVE
ncbi:MAG: DUF4430 domain-containing protein [Lachnospiraceae bacterium]|nr:DUF4430 domain-containing protein [Lachnospiraceae bacterium]